MSWPALGLDSAGNRTLERPGLMRHHVEPQSGQRLGIRASRRLGDNVGEERGKDGLPATGEGPDDSGQDEASRRGERPGVRVSLYGQFPKAQTGDTDLDSGASDVCKVLEKVSRDSVDSRLSHSKLGQSMADSKRNSLAASRSMRQPLLACVEMHAQNTSTCRAAHAVVSWVRWMRAS